jgi:hypothetical protein
VFDLEERLRTTVVRRSMGFEPSADLPDRISARVRHRRRKRQLMTGSLAAAAMAAAVAIVTLFVAEGRDEGSVRMADRNGPAMTVPEGKSGGSTATTDGGPASGPATSSTTTVAQTETPAAPAIGLLTPLSRHGIGPITAGMTLREAEEAARVTITPLPPSGSGSSCVEAQIAGLDSSTVLVVERPGQPGADVMDGVVRAVVGSVLPTDEGAIVGQMRDELVAALGQPTWVENAPSVWGPGAEFLVFEAGGYAYGALVVDGMVYGLQSGDPGWVSAAEGCP